MILFYCIILLIAGAIVSWIAGKWSPGAARIISLLTVLTDLIATVFFIFIPKEKGTPWLINMKAEWIKVFGINLNFSLDGLSLLLLLLTFFIGIIAIIISWKEIKFRVGFYQFNLLLTLAGITGVFLSMDLFLFYFFWELMLIPMFFIIGIWGDKNRKKAAYKFFLFSQIGGLLMLISILSLYFIHGAQTGVYTFNFGQLTGTMMSPATAYLIMSGFLAAFFVKLPVIPLHNWLPDAYVSAPFSGTILLAALLSKTAAYGLLRFIFPLFPDAALSFAPIGMILGIIGILYGAKLAYAQTDLKRLVAYTSISHMGFIVLGVFALNHFAYQGVVIQMLAHGITIAALFIIVWSLNTRLKTRNLDSLGGLWSNVPIIGSMGLIFAMASLGLPGMGNFIAEFLILLGTFKANVVMASIASVGLLASAIYTLRMIQRIFFGKKQVERKIDDLSILEKSIFGALIIVILWLGLYPNPILDIASPAINKSIIPLQSQSINSVNGSGLSSNKNIYFLH